MACRFEISLPAADGAPVDAAERALDEAERVEAMLSTFRENSEVARLNRLPVNEAVAPSADLFSLLQYCEQLHAATDGAFDITSAPLGRCQALARRENRQPTTAEIDRARALVGFGRLRLDASTGTVRLSAPGTSVSFGGIGKGYAVDRMGQILRARDVSHAIVSSGGSSVLAIGGPERGWPVDVRSGRPERPLRVCLRSGALGTSGTDGQFVLMNGGRHGGVLDPRTGREPREVRRATVVAPDATTADALATAFVVAGPALARSYCEQHTDTLAVLTMNDAAETRRVFGGYGGADLVQRRDAQQR